MTDTMSARERIRNNLQHLWDMGWFKARSGGGDAYDFQEEWVDDIIDIIRTALLSEPAVTAAMAVIEYRSSEPWAAQDWKEQIDDWHETVTAAFDAAMGGEQK